MNDKSVTALSQIVLVRTERHEDHVNKLLKEGWRLLLVDSVPMPEGPDGYVELKYLLGFPGQDPL